MTYYLFKYGYKAMFYSLLGMAGAMAIVTPVTIGGLVLLGVMG